MSFSGSDTAPAAVSRRDVAHVVGFAVAYAAAMTLARAFTIGPVVLSFVWPACGVATLWLLFAPSRRVRVVDAVVLGVVTTVVNVATSIEPGLSAWFGVVNVVQGVLGAWLLARLAPDLWGAGGRESFTRVRAVSDALAAAVVSSAAAAALAAPGLAVSGADVSVESVLLHFSRNTYGCFSVVVVVHLVLWAVRFGRTEPGHALVGGPGPLEGAALTAVTLTVYGAVYYGPVLPVAWAPLAVTIWAGLRFSPLVVAAQSTVGAVIAFAATIDGHGPLSSTASTSSRAWLLQGVLTVTLVSGLALAASRAQLLRILQQVDAERQASADQTDLMATTLGALRAGLLVIDPDGSVETTNAPAREILRRRLLGTIGLDLDTGGSWDDLWLRVLHTDGVVEFDAHVADGHVRQVLHVHAVPLERGRGVVVHLADVTAQQATRDELVGFASHAAHDLRGPLMAVRGWLDLLRAHLEQGDLTPDEGRLFVARATGTADRMSVLLDDLVDHAAGEGHRLAVEEVDLGELVSAAAEQAGALSSVTIGDLSAVRGDRTMLTRVVLNLIGNAVKYADPTRPLELQVTSTLQPTGEVEVCFTDNGIGIPADELLRVFEPFHRATSHGSGNGMGLAMCRQIVSRHGGTILARGNGDEPGTTVVVTLPAGQDAPIAVPQQHDALRRLGLLSRPS